ncbi:MAG: DUF4405 domain-containing protein [Candidimonas sp.]|nr:MAG: DUF4405 domain-containing protein [Candidimonas sp.]TAM19842.1 MAG: DUF4405 domain-containing protein [Candidimonas sp.]TAM78127.1 MAG: DUF4405 domain-containing protein [Candidimonas sp.]
MLTRSAPIQKAVHPAWLRVTHWINALAVVIMVTSGWRVYDASPLFGFSFPDNITLGGWLGGALQWHFAGMWLLAINGCIYLACNLASRRLLHKFFPLTMKSLFADVSAALRGRLVHADPRHYNSVQRLAYLVIIADLIVLVISGLVLWKSVQFPMLRDLLGGYDMARRVHFFAMALAVCFVALHVLMVALVPRTLITMIRGR